MSRTKRTVLVQMKTTSGSRSAGVKLETGGNKFDRLHLDQIRAEDGPEVRKGLLVNLAIQLPERCCPQERAGGNSSINGLGLITRSQWRKRVDGGTILCQITLPEDLGETNISIWSSKRRRLSEE